MIRKLTSEEIGKLHAELLEHLNAAAELEINKRDFLHASREQLDYHKQLITKIRQEINSGEVETSDQKDLPL